MRVFSGSAAVIVILLAGACFGPLPPAIASPVVDDDRLARDFVAGLGRLVDAADGGAVLDSERATEQLASVAGRRIALPPAGMPCALRPERGLYDTVVPAVVVVGSIFKCGKCNDWHLGGMASGWLASEGGLVVTNHHVFGREPGHRYGVMTADGTVYAVTGVLAADEAGDAAVARIDARGQRLPWLALGPDAECGDEVSVISHPAGRFFCLTKGVVSRFHRQRPRPESEGEGPAPAEEGRRPRPAGQPEPAGEQQAPTWMSVTADYALGSSGGPVFNTAGEVVGMVSRTSSSRQIGRRSRSAAPSSEQMVFKDCVSLDTLRKLLVEGSE
jgi:serine protease Do